MTDVLTAHDARTERKPRNPQALGGRRAQPAEAVLDHVRPGRVRAALATAVCCLALVSACTDADEAPPPAEGGSPATSEQRRPEGGGEVRPTEQRRTTVPPSTRPTTTRPSEFPPTSCPPGLVC